MHYFAVFNLHPGCKNNIKNDASCHYLCLVMYQSYGGVTFTYQADWLKKLYLGDTISS